MQCDVLLLHSFTVSNLHCPQMVHSKIRNARVRWGVGSGAGSGVIDIVTSVVISIVINNINNSVTRKECQIWPNFVLPCCPAYRHTHLLAHPCLYRIQAHVPISEEKILRRQGGCRTYYDEKTVGQFTYQKRTRFLFKQKDVQGFLLK